MATLWSCGAMMGRRFCGAVVLTVAVATFDHADPFHAESSTFSLPATEPPTYTRFERSVLLTVIHAPDACFTPSSEK